MKLTQNDVAVEFVRRYAGKIGLYRRRRWLTIPDAMPAYDAETLIVELVREMAAAGRKWSGSYNFIRDVRRLVAKDRKMVIDYVRPSEPQSPPTI